MFLVLWSTKSSLAAKTYEDGYGPAGDGPGSFEAIRTTENPVFSAIPFVRMFISRSISGPPRLLRKLSRHSQAEYQSIDSLGESLTAQRHRLGAYVNVLHEPLAVSMDVIIFAAKCGVALFSEPHGHKSIWCEIGLQEFTWRSVRTQDGFRARYPLRTAPSIVAGQPVSVQSPARNNPRTEDSCFGRQRSTPGSGENVGGGFFYDRRFHQFRLARAGSTCRTSSKHR